MPKAAKKETALDVLKDIRKTLEEMALEQIRYTNWQYSGAEVVTDKNERPPR
jgi:hypothetical protein